MGRSTKGKVVTTNISTSEIKKVFDSDKESRPLSDTNRKASDFFVDGNVNNSIYDNFIDEAYCPADEDETKKDKLTRKPYRWSQWRNYGGAEAVVDETIPEIFWANIVDSASGSDVERAPQTQEEFDIMNELNSIPGVVLYPSEEDINNQIDSSAINSRHLASSYQSTMFTGTRILNSKVATKVGIDYFANTSTSIPEFEIKVTPYVTDGISKIKYYRNVDVEGVITQEEKDTLLHIGGGLFLAIFGAKTIAELGPALIAWFNSLIGPFTPWGVIIKSLNQLWGKIWAWFLTLTEMPALATIASILEPIALFIGLILVADVVWDVFNPSAEILDMAYQYANTVMGNYVFEDIALSEYSYGFGRKYQQPEGKETKLISQDGESKEYDLNSFNSGASWDENNLFTRFPNQASGLPDKYLNWEFLPKSYQYDLDTPPPTIEYLVELVPIRNCKLSADKPTAFVVRVVPDKFLAPKFEAITSSEGVKGKDLYRNTTITFKNARYCDFIFMEDTTKHDEDDLFNLWGLLGDLFTKYCHAIINTDGNIGYLYNNFSYFDGRDITIPGGNLMVTKNNGITSWFPADYYNVNFMKEASPNIIYNQYFRTEYNSDISSKLTGLRQFWKTNEFVTISGGAATCSGGIGLLYQHIPTVGTGYYTLTLECSGDVYLKTGGSGSCFEYGVYSWDSSSDRTRLSQRGMDLGYSGYVIVPDCSKVILADELERIQFSSGFYKVIVKAKSTGTKDISFAMTDGSSISTCKLQKLPNSKASESTKRGCYNAITEENQKPQKIYWHNTGFTDRIVELLFAWEYNHEYNLSILVGVESFNVISDIDIKFTRVNTDPEIINVIFTPGEVANISYFSDMPVDKAEIIFKTLWIDRTIDPDAVGVTLACNDQLLIDITDKTAMLFDSAIDISSTRIGSTYQLNKNWNFKKHKYRLKGLNISNTQSSDSVENITSISDSIDISNTNVGGFFSQLSSIPRVICENTNISKYGTGQSYYSMGVEPYIVWKNSKTQIEESSLNLLLNTLAYSNTWNGTLDISGDNPEITNELSLANINILVGRNWNVLYNAVTVPVITLLGDNPLTWNLGEIFVDPGATALDGKDGDISEDIVIDVTDVNVNTIGSYSVTYNVTDSDSYAAEEVVRTVDVEDTIIPVITVLGADPATITQGDIYVDAGATALDNYDGDITDNIITYNPVNINAIGGYNVTYNVQDSSGNNAIEKGRVVNVISAGPVLPEVTIGTQTWKVKNLDVDDGLGGIYAYNNAEGNVAIYGRLYTWDAAVRVAVSVDGWHLPSDAEWTTLTTYLGGESIAGGKLKETGTTHWLSPNTGATNETGFTALPGGYRNSSGSFRSIGSHGYWWSATESSAKNARCRSVTSNSSGVSIGDLSKKLGYSVRLIKS